MISLPPSYFGRSVQVYFHSLLSLSSVVLISVPFASSFTVTVSGRKPSLLPLSLQIFSTLTSVFSVSRLFVSVVIVPTLSVLVSS